MHCRRRAHSARMAVVIRPQDDGVVSRPTPGMGRIGLIAYDRSVAKLPLAGRYPSAYAGRQLQSKARRHISVGGLEADAQSAGGRPELKFITADGRRIGPRLAVNIDAADVVRAPGARGTVNPRSSGRRWPVGDRRGGCPGRRSAGGSCSSNSKCNRCNWAPPARGCSRRCSCSEWLHRRRRPRRPSSRSRCSCSAWPHRRRRRRGQSCRSKRSC